MILRVAPHAGAWIETWRSSSHRQYIDVAPHAGAWIETTFGSYFFWYCDVAPHAGAWIETLYIKNGEWSDPSRAPRGRVD